MNSLSSVSKQYEIINSNNIQTDDVQIIGEKQQCDQNRGTDVHIDPKQSTLLLPIIRYIGKLLIDLSYNSSKKYQDVKETQSEHLILQKKDESKTELFKSSLDKWVNDPNATGSKVEAAKKIWSCYENKHWNLDIEGYNLNSLPDLTDELKWVEFLCLGNNKFSKVPDQVFELGKLVSLHLQKNRLSDISPKIAKLTNLAHLCLNNNRFNLFPASVCNLYNLSRLELNKNRITFISKDIVKLFNLKRLELKNNQLKSVPKQVGRLFKLRYLEISNNPNLVRIDPSLGGLPSIRGINVYRTDISEKECDFILESCGKMRESNCAIGFSDMLKDWLVMGNSCLDSKQFDSLDSNQKGLIYQWLVCLKTTAEFEKRRSELAALVCQMLKSLFENKDFNTCFFARIKRSYGNIEKDETGKVGNDAARDFEYLYESWMIHTQLEDKSLEGFLTKIVKVAKNNRFELIISRAFDNYDDRILLPLHEYREAQLHFLIKAKKTNRADLICWTENIHYNPNLNIDWIDEEKLFSEVNENYIEDFAESPILDWLYENPDIRKEYKNLIEDLDKVFEKLDQKISEHNAKKLQLESDKEMIDEYLKKVIARCPIDPNSKEAYNSLMNDFKTVQELDRKARSNLLGELIQIRKDFVAEKVKIIKDSIGKNL